MNYSLLIQNRKSTREFTSRKVSKDDIEEITSYYKSDDCERLLPEIRTDLLIFEEDAQEDLEGAAGYNDFLIGAPNYLVLLSEKAPYAGINAGYIMEDLILKLQEMELGSCWITFADSNEVKEALDIDSPLDVAAIAAFGHGQKAVRSLHVNVKSMYDVDISAKHQYFNPKKKFSELVFKDTWGNSEGVDEFVESYGDMLGEAFYAACLSPSYLNRQPYGFIIHEKSIYLIKTDDPYTTKNDSALDLGIVLLHFTSVAAGWMGSLKWQLGDDKVLTVPENYQVIGKCEL